MSRKEKLLEKLLSNPKDLTFDEAESLLGSLGYTKDNKGKTSGSRVSFVHGESGVRITLHKPHPRKELLDYQVKQLKEHLKQEGLI